MATVQGVVISVSLEGDVAKNGGGTYKGWELVYKTLDGRVQSIAKPVQGLKFNAALKAQLSALAPGDNFTLTQEKNAQGFNDVKTVVKGLDTSVAEPSGGGASSTPRVGQSNNSYASRDFETKDERTVKQKLIVRQSSLSQAVSVLSVGAKTSPKTDEVLALAQQFTDWVYGGTPRQLAEQAVQDMEDDLPY